MKISQLVEQFIAVLPIGCALDEEQITRSLRAAVRKYCGYAQLASAQSTDGVHTDIDATPTALGAQDFDLNPSELAIIEPLWVMYMEKENSTVYEVSRSQGADPWGRAVAEVAVAIADYETRLPSLTFSFEVRSI